MATLLERTREINDLLQEFEEIEYPEGKFFTIDP